MLCSSCADEVDRYRFALIQTLFASFPKYLSPANMKVKVLPAGNQSIIVAVLPRFPGSDRRADADGALYVVDLAALSLDEVHRRLQGSDAHFECDYQNCACLPIALEVRCGGVGHPACLPTHRVWQPTACCLQCLENASHG